MPRKKKSEPTILIIDDEKDVHYSFQRLLSKEPYRILSADNAEQGIQLVEDESPDLVVMDIRMGRDNGLDALKEIRGVNSKQVVIMMTAYGTSQTAIEAMKRGAFDYVLKPFDIPELKQLIARGLEAATAMKDEISPGEVTAEEMQSGFIGDSPAMQKVYKQMGQVAPTDATVLIQGESGTGKELVARSIYDHSRRAGKPFVIINSAAIPENLLESELFGHEKGSFTGAMTQRIGKFEQCDGGTIFLDEIGEMPMPIQSKLLRVIQEGEFTRVGGNKPIYVDVRLIAATNRDLAAASRVKEFREDLYYRLNVVTIELPPLRERREDVPQLVAYFMRKWQQRNPEAPRQLSPDALEYLKGRDWPGNVRELENAIQRAMVLAAGDTITRANLEGSPGVTKGDGGESPDWDGVIDHFLDEAESHPDTGALSLVEKATIIRALKRSSGNSARAAKLLGLTAATLKSKIEKYGIEKAES
jgi:nitrogen regulation protein NR(I)